MANKPRTNTERDTTIEEPLPAIPRGFLGFGDSDCMVYARNPNAIDELCRKWIEGRAGTTTGRTAAAGSTGGTPAPTGGEDLNIPELQQQPKKRNIPEASRERMRQGAQKAHQKRARRERAATA